MQESEKMMMMMMMCGYNENMMIISVDGLYEVVGRGFSMGEVIKGTILLPPPQVASLV